MLGKENLSGGQCKINQVSVADFYLRPEELFGIVGYCPQTNSMESILSARKILTHFSNLLGVKQEMVESLVNDTLDRFNLTQYADTMSGYLSGGNKRKLCCALAFLGNP